MENKVENKVKFFDRVKKNEYYKKWIKSPLTYVAAAVLLAIFQIITLAATGNPWGVSGVFAYWGAWLVELFGGSVDKWYYFASPGAQSTLDAGFLAHAGTWRNLGIIFGALAATLLASGFKIKKIKSKKQIVAAILGGLAMGYGARIAAGCNIGALFSGIASLSVSGWVFAVAMFAGAVVGSKLLVKFFM
ncbi:YeeE/YedE family protein [Acidaminobacter sp. JC074]|uniref:YeeE/YedE thiosulfate transporter family protein n=1 Tax=Acidaminobacter sp. JC074 TaxID=2530199 RepID=UPI001F0E87BA|nr:YeeE/YedE thiosulfate transporter family protein [Acidaminobacter sp. JC074]MCH4888433.1 YeeE/YedE family protein [Acidaminobacter sp. JC074]